MVTTAPRSLLTDEECRPPRRARGSYRLTVPRVGSHGSNKYRPAGSNVFDIVAGSRGKPPLKRPKTGRLNGARELKIPGQWEGLSGPRARHNLGRVALIWFAVLEQICEALLKAEFPKHYTINHQSRLQSVMQAKRTRIFVSVGQDDAFQRFWHLHNIVVVGGTSRIPSISKNSPNGLASFTWVPVNGPAVRDGASDLPVDIRFEVASRSEQGNVQLFQPFGVGRFRQIGRVTLCLAAKEASQNLGELTHGLLLSGRSHKCELAAVGWQYSEA